MVHTMFHNHRTTGTREYLNVITIYGHVGHLGHVTHTILCILSLTFPWMLLMKFGQAGLRGWKIVTIFMYTASWQRQTSTGIKPGKVVLEKKMIEGGQTNIVSLTTSELIM